jgi:hypothetical protein
LSRHSQFKMPEQHSKKANLQPDEVGLGTWSIFYLPPAGRGYAGHLTVTSRRLLYDASFDASLKSMMADAPAVKWDSEGYLAIDKANIRTLEVQQKSTTKQCILTLTDGSKHCFECPRMDETLAAIKALESPPAKKTPIPMTFAKAAGCTLVHLVVFGIIAALVGVFVDFFTDVIGSIPYHRDNSSPLAFYAIAFVFGVFCGFFNYRNAGEIISPRAHPYLPGKGSGEDWTDRQDAGKTGLLVIVTTGAVLAALFIAFVEFASWDELLDSASLALTYLTTVLAAEVFIHVSLGPQPAKST